MVHVDVEVELADLNEVDLFVDSDDAPQYHVELVLFRVLLAHCSEPPCFSPLIRARDLSEVRVRTASDGFVPGPNGCELEPAMQDSELEW